MIQVSIPQPKMLRSRYGIRFEGNEYRVQQTIPLRSWIDSESILLIVGYVRDLAKTSFARLAFVRATPDAQTLPIALLERMVEHYPEPPKVRYDPEGLILRANDSVGDIARVLDLRRVRSALELGCKDGMVAAALAKKGIRSFGLDISRIGAGACAFDKRGREAGANFIQADAAHLPFCSGSFDLVFSFDSFEHFPNPATVLAEAARVLVPGGHLFLKFGPIATAPFGLHAYRSIPVPYVHILFDLAEVVDFAKRSGRDLDWPFINNLSLQSYRKMFREVNGELRIASYKEYSSGGVGAELIFRYPGAFRRVSDDIDDFLVSSVVILMERL